MGSVMKLTTMYVRDTHFTNKNEVLNTIHQRYTLPVLKYLGIIVPIFILKRIMFPLLCSCRDLGWQQRYAPFCGRIVVLSILSLLLYPFLWAWTVIGTLWFTSARSCVSFQVVWS